jgi:hypothetical protein
MKQEQDVRASRPHIAEAGQLPSHSSTVEFCKRLIFQLSVAASRLNEPSSPYLGLTPQPKNLPPLRGWLDRRQKTRGHNIDPLLQ